MSRLKKCLIVMSILGFAIIMIIFHIFSFQKDSPKSKKETETTIVRKIPDDPYKYSNEDIVTDEKTGISYVKNIIGIFFNENTSQDKKFEIINMVNGKIVGGISAVNQVQVKVPETDYQGLKKIIGSLEEKEEVLAVTSDIAMPIEVNKKKDFKSEEPKKNYQDKASWYQKIGAESLEQYNTSHINVGVVDTGFDFDHSDVEIIDLSKVRSDDKDHGTHVAGIIGAKHNDYGINGVLSNCTIYGYDCVPEEYQESYMLPQSCMFYGLIACVEKGCKVINYSLGFSSYDENLTELEKYEMGNNWSKYMYIMLHAAKIQQSDSLGDFVVVQAAGNGYGKNKNATIKGRDASNTGFFACISKENCYYKDDISADDIMNRILIVANAAEKNGEYMLDLTSNGGGKISISAPGEGIYSTVENGYALDSGTSMAAPMVTGAAAGIWSIYPEMTGAEVKNAIVESAENIVRSNPKAPNSADNNQTLYKFLNIQKALNYCETMELEETKTLDKETKTENIFSGTVEEFKEVIKSATDLDVVYITTADFDANGKNEAFAVTTSEKSKDPYWGYHTAEIWFADNNGECQCIKNEENISVNDAVLGGKKLFFNYERHEYQTSSVSCLYGVKDGQPYELKISGQYMNFRLDDNLNKYIAENAYYDEGRQYDELYFEYDDSIEEFYKITN